MSDRVARRFRQVAREEIKGSIRHYMGDEILKVAIELRKSRWRWRNAAIVSWAILAAVFMVLGVRGQ